MSSKNGKRRKPKPPKPPEVYHLYVLDEEGTHSASWSHRDGFPCLHFTAGEPVTIVLEHHSVTTFIALDGEGDLTIDQV